MTIPLRVDGAGINAVATPPLAGTNAAATAFATEPALAPPTSGGSAVPTHPGLRFDFALNVMVLEFYDPNGNVASSIPTARQLQAYRLGSETAAGAAPVVVQPPSD